MEIVVLTDYDSAGNMYNLCSGVNRYTEHNALLMKLRVHPVAQYPSMIVADETNMIENRKQIYDADVVVFKEFWWVADKFGLNMSKLKGKSLIAIMGGGGFRLERNRVDNLSFFLGHKMKLATSSVDFLGHSSLKNTEKINVAENRLQKPGESRQQFKRRRRVEKMLEGMSQKHAGWRPNDMAWIPPCVRYEEIREKYDYKSKTSPPLVFASPSRNTDLMLQLKTRFQRAMTELREEKLRFKFHCASSSDKMISNGECLRLKAPASIFFDRIYDIYGINSQEAAAFEEVVVTGTSQFTMKKLRQFGFNCPFIIVKNYDQTKNAIRKLLQDKKYRVKKAEECRAYAEKLHSGRESAKRLIALLRN